MMKFMSNQFSEQITFRAFSLTIYEWRRKALRWRHELESEQNSASLSDRDVNRSLAAEKNLGRRSAVRLIALRLKSLVYMHCGVDLLVTRWRLKVLIPNP